LETIAEFDFSKRPSLATFYSLVMPEKISNRYDKIEYALAYLVRHTQLLPREFLMLFSDAIRMSHSAKGSWRYIEANAIRSAVAENEAQLARSILSPYKNLYGPLIDACEDVLPETPPVCSLSELHKAERRFPRSVREQFDNPWRLLFEIGVLGYVEGNHEETDLYVYGSFRYNASKPITFANHMKYCFHPVFSGSWHLPRLPSTKFVYPARISKNVMEGIEE
jgi:hypothetical protein